MSRVVRFVSDTEPYDDGDFGDMGKEVRKSIEDGDTIVVGMVVFDPDGVEAAVTGGVAYETAVHHHTIDSLWCIDVPSAAINDCDKDITDFTVVHDEYLRGLAELALTPPASQIT